MANTPQAGQSVIYVRQETRTQSYPTSLANTNVTDCYTNSEAQAVKGGSVHIGNENAGTVVARIYWYDATATTAYCLHAESIATIRGYTYDLKSLRLDVGDKIQVQGDSGVDVTVTVQPFHGPG